MTEFLPPLAHSIHFIFGMSLILAAILDFIYFRLPNNIFYVIFYLFPLYIVLSSNFYLVSNYLVFVGTMLVCFGLFAATIIGGGDAKFLSATALWVGWDNMVPFITWMLIFGGIFSFFYLIIPRIVHHITAQLRHFIQERPFLKKNVQFFIPDIDTIEGEIITLQKKKMFPYGISIAGAGLMILLKGTM